ncbi:MAG TPA: PAS domain S-box protein [Terriglobales bacterium]|nr:PAS domain S-box protein [Terriglobales bacterium]
MPEEEKESSQPRTPRHLEQEEAKLWRMVLWFLILLATAVAALSWDRLQSLPYRLGALPVGLLALAVLFAVYSYGRKKQVVELQGLLRGLQDRVTTPPTEEQLDQLGQLIAKSQRSFKELIDSFDDVAFAISLDGTIRTVNRRLTEMLGVAYNAAIGHKLDEFIDEPKRGEVETGLARFIERRRWSGLVQVRLKGASRTLYFDCVVNAIVKGDEVVGVSVLARDVTEEREKERLFTELFETLHEGVYFSTPEGKLLEANAFLVRALGYETKQELLALDPKALNSNPEERAVLGRTADDEGGLRTREISLRRKDGKTSTFLDSSRAVWDNSGKIIRYQGTLVDITDRRNMEAALRQQEEFQRYLLESFPDLILVLNMEERYSFVSSRIRDLLGYKPEDLLGKKLGEEGRDSLEFLGLCQEVASGRKRFGFCEYAARHRDQSYRTMRASASPLFDADKKINGVIVSVRDITVEKKLEQQIIQSERLAAMGQMIGGFAHELNNPLTSILGIVELMQEVETDEGVRKQLNTLQQQSRRAAEIVQNLTYFSRPPAPGKSAVQLGEIVQRTLHLHAYSLRKNNITVDFLPDASLPPVSGDPHQLMQVFLNLVLNAEQAMREVREKGTLRIRLGKRQNQVFATFQDDGPGIAPEILPNIFDPFYTTKRPGRGTGLGLSICKAIVREHGGNVEAASGPGGGAVFTVTLPASGDAPAPQIVS